MCVRVEPGRRDLIAGCEAWPAAVSNLVAALRHALVLPLRQANPCLRGLSAAHEQLKVGRRKWQSKLQQQPQRGA